MKKIHPIYCSILLVILSLTSYGQQFNFGYDPKLNFSADPALRLYTSLQKPEVAVKLYSYESCFKMKGDSIIAIDNAAVETYIQNITETGLFSDQYITRERKWIDAIGKEIASNGFYKKDFNDKYYGTNPEGFKKDLAEWDASYKKNRSHPATRFTSSKRGYSGNLRAMFTNAGYEMKYGIRGKEGSDEVWKIDSIEQKS